MKCGKEVSEGQVFCKECLTQMEQYPIKPGTPVQLPLRQSQPSGKRYSRKKDVPVEVRLKRQRTAIAWLCGLLLASWVGLGFTVAMLFQETLPQEPQAPVPRTTLITG